MRKIFLLCSLFLALIAILTSCNGGLDSEACLKSVKKEFPNQTIYSVYNSNYKFVVIDSVGTVKMVTTGSCASPKITNVDILIKR